MRVLHVITSLKTGGAEKLMVDLLPRLKQSGIEVELCLFDGTDTPFKQLLIDSGIPIISFSNNRSVYHPANFIQLVKLIRNKKYDIIHTHNTAPQFFAALASVLCSVVLCTTEHSTMNRRRGSWLYGLIDRWMYGRYAKVICISDKTEHNLRNSLTNFHPPTEVIYNGIDTQKYHSATPGGIDKSIDCCDVALIQVAGFRYQKDQKTVIRCLKFLPKSTHAYFVGDGEMKTECFEYAVKCGVSTRTHFLGLRTDVPSLLKAADIVIMSSHLEGFGLAAIEGMAAGKPTIASDVDGLREVINGGGITFAKGDANDLSQKIKSLIQDKKYYMKVATSGAERANTFDISKMVDGYKEIYFKLFK